MGHVGLYDSTCGSDRPKGFNRVAGGQLVGYQAVP